MAADTIDILGVDPYDALRSRRLPAFVRSTSRRRQVAVQLRKRIPFDLSGVLGIRPFAMAKAVACFLGAHARCVAAKGEADEADTAVADELHAALVACEGNRGSGRWGYEFDVQTRWAFYPAGSPNLIATAFVARSLVEAGVVFGRGQWIEEAESCAGFLMSDMLRDSSPGAYFRYTEDSDVLVHNANLLGCQVVGAVGWMRDHPEMVHSAMSACQVSILAQHPDGSWPYGEGDSLAWCDSFHTAYNLDALLTMSLLEPAGPASAALDRGARDWLSAFFGAEGEPYYFRKHPRPYDIHCAATAADVASRLSQWGVTTAGIADLVAEWTGRHLIDPRTGKTWYRKNRTFTDRRHFVRWGDAHWALAQGARACRLAGVQTPFEAGLAGQS